MSQEENLLDLRKDKGVVLLCLGLVTLVMVFFSVRSGNLPVAELLSQVFLLSLVSALFFN